MRLTINYDDAINLMLTLERLINNKNSDIFPRDIEVMKKVIGSIREEIVKPPHPNKKNATIKATQTKIDKTKNKIFNAVNLMRLEGKKITVYSVSKEAKVSYNSAKKYKYLYENYIN